jgi:hypothetical protein
MAQDVRRSSHAGHHAVTPKTVPQHLLGSVDLTLNLLENYVRQQRLSTHQSSQARARNPKLRAAPVTLPPASTSACLTAAGEVVGAITEATFLRANLAALPNVSLFSRAAGKTLATCVGLGPDQAGD